MAIAKRDEGKKVNSNINVTPMVDVMLVLLIIFMVITPMLNDKVSVDLPKVTAAVIMDNANKEDAISAPGWPIWSPRRPKRPRTRRSICVRTLVPTSARSKTRSMPCAPPE